MINEHKNDDNDENNSHDLHPSIVIHPSSIIMMHRSMIIFASHRCLFGSPVLREVWDCSLARVSIKLFTMDKPIKIDDLGVPPFQEPPNPQVVKCSLVNGRRLANSPESECGTFETSPTRRPDITS